MKTARVAILFLMALSSISCAQKNSPYDAPTPDYLLSKSFKQLTFLGENDHPRFSDNGTKILYVSRNRAAHKRAQIYELDLVSNRDRRVTFSDGDAFDPAYISDGEILYASTTDEIKENPIQNKNVDKDSPPSDLYMSDIYGSDIVRLSFQPGFDAEPLFVPHPVKPFILFSSKRDNTLGLYRLDLKNLPVSVLSNEPGKNKTSMAVSPDLKDLAWIERDLKTNEQSIMLYNFKNKKTQLLKKGEGDYRDLSWAPKSPQRLFYSLKRSGQKFFQIELIQIADNCTQVVFKGNDNLVGPAVSNDSNEKLAFVRIFQDKKQIYMVSLPEDLGPCLAPPTQANLKQ